MQELIIKHRFSDSIIAESSAFYNLKDFVEQLVKDKKPLRYANLRGADLRCADLIDSDLNKCIGNLKEIKSIHVEKYTITYTNETMAIGCKQYSIDEWFSFDDETIAEMYTDALDWWKKWKDFIKMSIELSFNIKIEEEVKNVK